MKTTESKRSPAWRRALPPAALFLSLAIAGTFLQANARGSDPPRLDSAPSTDTAATAPLVEPVSPAAPADPEPGNPDPKTEVYTPVSTITAVTDGIGSQGNFKVRQRNPMHVTVTTNGNVALIMYDPNPNRYQITFELAIMDGTPNGTPIWGAGTGVQVTRDLKPEEDTHKYNAVIGTYKELYATKNGLADGERLDAGRYKLTVFRTRGVDGTGQGTKESEFITILNN